MKRFGAFRLDTSNECLWEDERKVLLPPKPFGVLRYLVEHADRLVTHDELLDALWPETYVQPQVLRTYVLDLRKVLGDTAGQPRFIQTVPKRGYCFVATVSEDSETAPSVEWKAAEGRSPESAPNVAAAYVSQVSIVGRSTELARLTESFAALENGRQILFVTGEAGIGKTTLVEGFCDGIRSSEPVRLGRGQCIEGFGAREEYYPVIEALEQLCAGADGKVGRRVLARKAPAWLALVPPEPEDAELSSSSPNTAEQKLGDLCAAFEELAAERPLILFFEDLHWADSGTLNLLSALARRRARARLMVIGTYRQQHGETEHFKTLRQDLLMRRLGAEVEVGSLSRAAVGDLLRTKFSQQEFPPELDTFVHQHSEGNPLFAIAIVEHLVTQRVLKHGVKGWTLQASAEGFEVGVPAGLAQMIELEIESLNRREQEILEAGSLTNVVFPAWAVAAALDEDATEIEEACDRLARRLYFLKRCGEDELPDGTRSAFYVFAHGMYREVLYQRQAGSRRAERHIRIAERIRKLFAERAASVASEMAMHYEAAGSWRAAIDALLAAASHAHQRQAQSEAGDLLARALRIAVALQEPDGESIASDIRTKLNTWSRLQPLAARP